MVAVFTLWNVGGFKHESHWLADVLVRISGGCPGVLIMTS